MRMAQFAIQAVQPVVTLFVQDMLGQRPDLATLGGLAFSVTGIAGVLAVPFLGHKSDIIGHRTILLISLLGAALFTAPQALPLGYSALVIERFGLGLFVGGILPAANALIRTPDDRIKPWFRIRHGVVGLFHQEHARAPYGWCCCCDCRHPLCLRCDRSVAADQLDLGLVHRS
jgi:MFS family permease